MKKIALFCAFAMSLGFVACDGYEEPNPPAQSNPQEAIFETENLTVTLGEAAAQTISLFDYNNENKNIEIANYQIANFPEKYELQMVMEIAGDDSFARVGEVATTVADGVITVAPDALQGAYVSTLGKSPKEKEIAVRFVPYAVNGSSKVRIGGPDFFYGPFKVNILPIPGDLVIEDNYYLIGTVNGWDVPTAVKLSHSDKSPYDDPVFAIAVNISAEEAAAGWWWKILPESTVAAGTWQDVKDGSFGPAENGDESLSGMLIGRTETEDSQAGCLKVQGPYVLTINMEEGTYEFSMAIENLYTPGNSNGWSQTASQMLFTSNYTDYEGFAHLNGEFKFTSQADWNGINYGSAGDGELSTDGGAGNINAGADGLYWCKVNIASMTYDLTQITSAGIIGGFNGWGAQEALTPSSDFLTWSGTFHMSAGDEWKFRFNDTWDINLGGDVNSLTPGGDNLKCDADGDYVVTLNLATLPYTCTVVKK